MADNLYQSVIDALNDAPTAFNPLDPYQRSYTVFGPGGVSWHELADIIETLRDDVDSLNKLVPAFPPNGDEPEYEYSYSHADALSKGNGSIAGSPDSYKTWFSTVEEATAAMNNDLRWAPRTFLISRTKAGDAFALDPEDAA